MNRTMGSDTAGATSKSDAASAAAARFAAPAKLNLFLHVVGRRADGYHLLQTVFRFIDYGDTLGFSVRDDGVVRRVSELAGVPDGADLCLRAARLLQGSRQVTPRRGHRTDQEAFPWAAGWAAAVPMPPPRCSC